jgi:hypothetical protein
MDDPAPDDRQCDRAADDRRGSSREDIAVKDHDVRIGAYAHHAASALRDSGEGRTVAVRRERIGKPQLLRRQPAVGRPAVDRLAVDRCIERDEPRVSSAVGLGLDRSQAAATMAP